MKNGHTRTGKQLYKCHACSRQSREDPAGRAYPPERKAEILRAYEERSSLRGLTRTFGVSRTTVIAWLKGGSNASSDRGDADPSRPGGPGDAGAGAG